MGGLWAVASLALVLALLLGAAHLARRFGTRLLGGRMPGQPSQARIAHRGAIPLDARRRLHFVEIDGRGAVLLTGGTQDLLLPWPDERATP
jgi:flagellar biogenesis protein FliO